MTGYVSPPGDEDQAKIRQLEAENATLKARENARLQGHAKMIAIRKEQEARVAAVFKNHPRLK